VFVAWKKAKVFGVELVFGLLGWKDRLGLGCVIGESEVGIPNCGDSDMLGGLVCSVCGWVGCEKLGFGAIEVSMK
jgi:hypothetical protein